MAVKPPRLLILRALGLGDFLTAVPALRALARAFPDHQRELVAPPALGPLVSLTGAVDRLIPASGLRSGPALEPRPRVAVNLHGKGPESHHLLLSAEPEHLVAYRGPGAALGPHWSEEEHEVERWSRLVGETCGRSPGHGDLRLPRPTGAPRWPPYTAVVHPGAASGSRRWPAERFAEVAGRLESSGWRVVITGSSQERALARKVARLAGLPAHRAMAGRTSLAELAGLVHDCGLLVSGDTGIAHLASAFGTRSVVLFGPVSPSVWGPPEDGPHVALWAGSTGDPHGELPDPGLLRIGVDDVSAGVSAVAPGAPPR